MSSVSLFPPNLYTFLMLFDLDRTYSTEFNRSGNNGILALFAT